MSQKEDLQKVIYQARWVDGIKNAEIVTDQGLTDAILNAGFRRFPVIETPEELRKLEPGMNRGPIICNMKTGQIDRVGTGICAMDDEWLIDHVLPCIVLWGTEE